MAQTPGGSGLDVDLYLPPFGAGLHISHPRKPRRWLRAQAESVGACGPAGRRGPPARRPTRRWPLSIVIPGGQRATPAATMGYRVVAWVRRWDRPEAGHAGWFRGRAG